MLSVYATARRLSTKKRRDLTARRAGYILLEQMQQTQRSNDYDEYRTAGEAISASRRDRGLCARDRQGQLRHGVLRAAGGHGEGG